MPTSSFRQPLAIAFLLLAFAGGGPAEAQTTFCQPVVVQSAMTNTTFARGINNNGDVVGSYLTPHPFDETSAIAHGFLLRNGLYTTIDIEGTSSTELYGINDAGHMVGSAGGRAFSIIDGAVTFLPLGGGPNTASGATDINNNGDIVGFRRDAPDFLEKGFVLKADGSLHTVVYSGIRHTAMWGINDNGVGVGWSADGFRSAAFTWNAGGGARSIGEFPGGYGTEAWGISNAGVIVGTYASFSAPFGGAFVRPFGPRGRFSRFTCPDVDSVYVLGTNDKGAVVGGYGDPGGQGNHSFYTRSVRFLDPVPDLTQGRIDVTTNGAALATKGRDVQGIAADGVSQIVVRIPTSDPGQQVTVTILKDETTPATSAEEKQYGALGRISGRCPGDGCTQSQVTTTSLSQIGGAFAFVIYRAPEDFARGDSDAGLKHRDVYLRIESPGGAATLPLRVVRPPVAVIHGIWDDDSLWENFRPLVWGTGNNDPRFSIFRINYGMDLSASVITSFPRYPPHIIRKTKGSAVGFEYNAKVVQRRIREEIESFKTGRNPAGMSVAAVQVDVVAHSMGGNVTRTMPLLADFLGGNTFGEGIVHKLVTIDTPHKGSVLATLLVVQMQGGHFCVPFYLGEWGDHVALRTVTLRGAGTVSGAVRDLVHNVPSDALNQMNTQQVHRIPTATIAGEYTNWGYLTGNIYNNFLHDRCPADVLAQHVTAQSWPTLFDGPTDGTVSVSSQNPNGHGRQPFTNYVHSGGMVKLGFAPPVIVSNGEVAVHVILLLNKPLSDTQFYLKLPQ